MTSSKNQITSWFRDNFETATESLFYDSQEGGFQYPAGSNPVDVRPVLENNFPKATQETISEAVTELEDEGPWMDFKKTDEERQ
ncbi:MAG TPA: hypothetical protein VGB69_09100 [Edaphobacter sp.]